MIATYIYKNNQYYCSNCRMRALNGVEPYCPFCGYEMSNYEEIMIEALKHLKDS